ncbi:hypothetical protein [Nocardia sp. AG03]|uniref:hypothetical protein n=1 Tax=Nocardia sp. AG03 TaxID=3025312 RepID=UPI0024187BDA|nr:hypothetical protein [Nocardia sp. AG03]
MNDLDTVILKAIDVWYHSPGDEAAFFDWLGKIRAVHSVGGQLRTLDIAVKTPVDDDSLREILALFRRYDIEMAQLRKLDNAQVSEWFHDPQKYWHEPVFGRVDS